MVGDTKKPFHEMVKLVQGIAIYRLTYSEKADASGAATLPKLLGPLKKLDHYPGSETLKISDVKSTVGAAFKISTFFRVNFSPKSMCSLNNDVVVPAQVQTYKANERSSSRMTSH